MRFHHGSYSFNCLGKMWANIPWLKKKVIDQQVIFSATSKCRDNWTNDRKVGFLPNWYLYPSITSIKGLIFNQALSHLPDTEKRLNFPAKCISIYVCTDIDHLPRPLLLLAVKVTISATSFEKQTLWLDLGLCPWSVLLAVWPWRKLLTSLSLHLIIWNNNT